MEGVTHPTCNHSTCTSCPSANQADTPIVALATSTPINLKKITKRKSVHSRGKKIRTDISDSFDSEDIVGQLRKAASASLLEEDEFNMVNYIDLQTKIQELQLKVCSLEHVNDKITDEKLRLSSQLGIQTKVRLRNTFICAMGCKICK